MVPAETIARAMPMRLRRSPDSCMKGIRALCPCLHGTESRLAQMRNYPNVSRIAAAAALEELMNRWIELGLPGDGDGEREARFKRAAAAILDTLG